MAESWTPSACLGSQDGVDCTLPGGYTKCWRSTLGSQPARLLVGLFQCLAGPSATSEVLPYKGKKGQGEGSVPSEHQMGHIALNRQWPGRKVLANYEGSKVCLEIGTQASDEYRGAQSTWRKQQAWMTWLEPKQGIRRELSLN